ncbi:hypothetical protein [Nostoc sp.]|uniref:hypothetical protein n=1 Tax=Nostoc sp. TaxID=1180 RepID=UPI002FF3F18B
MEITHRRGLCPKQSAPLFLGIGALETNRTPIRGVLKLSSAPTLELPGKPSVKSESRPCIGMLGGFERQNWVN